MKTAVRMIAPLAMLLFGVASAFAQTEYRFEIFAAAGVPLDKDFLLGLPQASPPVNGTFDFSPGVRGGVRFGADFKKYWGEDFIYSYGYNFSKIRSSAAEGQFAIPTRSHQFAINALWYPGGVVRNAKVTPYLTAGVGGTFFTTTSKTFNAAKEAGLGELRTENVFAFNAGGGLRMRLGDHFGLRLDGRDYMSRVPRFGMPEKSEDPNALVFPASGVFHNLEASIALVFYF